MKILIIDSSRNEKSRNRKFSKQLIDKLCSKHNLKYINPIKYELLPCLGCCKCFKNGKCPLDSNVKDSASKIKVMLKWSDLVIFNSPVYAHSVSGDMKILIDRLSYWLHTFELKGRGSILLTTTDTNGGEEHNSYFGKILTGWGLVKYSEVIFYNSFTGDYEKKLLNDLIEKIDVFDLNNLHSSREHEAMFTYFKYIYLNTNDLIYEKQIWKERGYFNKNSFQELLEEGKNVYKKNQG